MRGKKRPPAEREAAIALAEVSGVEQAAKATGIPERTIYYWLDDPRFAELRAKTRDEMRDGFRVLVHKAQERLEALVPTMEPRDLTILLGVATDKALLVGGDPTSRSEVNSFHGYNDHEKRAIAGILREAASGVGTTEPAAGDAEGAAVVGAGPTGAASPTG